MAKVIVNKNQSVWDLANQYYGSVDGVEQLMLDNPGVVNFLYRVAAGTIINIDDTKIIDANIVDYLSTNGLKPATACLDDDWILADGTWNDDGVWDDTEDWTD